MARFSAGARTTAGTTARPMMSIYSAAASTGTLREVGVFNTTATAVEIGISRLSTTGIQGASITSVSFNVKKPPALCTAFTTHTADATATITGYRAVLGAAVGSGVIWTFGDDGLTIGILDAAELVTNGIGVILLTGIGQICQTYMVWDE